MTAIRSEFLTIREKHIFTQDGLGRVTSIVVQDANNQKISEKTYAYFPNSITETQGSVSTTTTYDALGNPISMDRVDSEEGLGTQIWNATLGDPRVQGGLTAASGIGEMLLGGVLWLIPDPTLLSKVGGGALLAHGADMTAAGLKQLWTNQTTPTFTTQGLSKGLQSIGIPNYYASMVGTLTEIGMAAVPVGLIAKVGTAGKAGVKALYGVPALTAEARAATSAGLPVFSLEPHAGGVIRSFVQETDQIYYRVFTQGQTGGFLTAVRPGSSAFAQEALALPPQNTATFIQEVLVPAGTRLQRSRTLPAFGRRGGAEQFQLMNQIPPRNFGPGVPLQ